MKLNILTQFPDMFAPVTSESILGRAVKNEILEVNVINIRDYSTDRHLKTDDTPFGGGAGMVMLCQPAFDALKDIYGDPFNAQKTENTYANASAASKRRILYMSPRGHILDQALIEELSVEDEITILCGHYEGVDQRIIDAWNMDEVSIGDYVLTGGELAAMVLIDAVSRLVPGVLGSSESLSEESIYSGLLEYPQYTKPREYEGLAVPEVLCNGNHKLIHEWQWEKSLELTRDRRPDLFEKYVKSLGKLSKSEKKILDRILK